MKFSKYWQIFGWTLWWAGCHLPSHVAPGKAQLIFLSDVRGVLAPCGCTSNPLGGLERVAKQIEQLQAAAPSKVMLLGYTFTDPNQPNHPQSSLKTPVLMKYFAHLPAAWLVLAEDEPLPPSTSQLNLHQQGLGVHIEPLAGWTIGVLASQKLPSWLLLRAAIDSLQTRQVDYMVLMVAQAEIGAAEALLSQFAELNLLVLAGKPMQLAHRHRLLLVAGQRGEHLSVVTLHRGQTGHAPISYYQDSPDISLQQKIHRLQQELTQLDSTSAAYRVRHEMLEQLQRQAVPIQPTGSYFTVEMKPIHAQLPTAKWAEELFAGYNQALCTQTTDCATLPPAHHDAYAGVARCGSCHAAAMQVWQATAHAHAWETLQNVAKHCDTSCIGCHVVGYQQPGGFCLQSADKNGLTAVGCESCHGPGDAHSLHPGNPNLWSSRFVRRPNRATCQNCHTPEHSDHFNYLDYLPKILGPGHGQPLATP